ncbi:MAG TPA: YdeI/OmpD-associated family protein [Acidimicrobiales bacterium]|jgi:hypothetical protein
MAAIAFTAEAHHRGRSATLVWVPDGVAATLGDGVRLPVEGRVNGLPYRGWVRRVRDGGPWYLLVDRTIRAGDPVAVEVDVDPAPDRDELPEDVADVLAGFPRAQAGWDDLPPKHRAEYLAWIDEAPSAAVRNRRIMASIDKLRADEP